MTKGAIICQQCGAKLRSTRARCPRCRALITGPPAPEPRLSKRATAIGGAALAMAIVATLAILWPSEKAAVPAAGVKANDPLGERRQGVAAPVVTHAAEVPPDPPFELSSRVPAIPQSGDDEASLASFQRAIERNPQDAEALYNAGSALVRLRRPQEALPPLKQAAALQADNAAYVFAYGYASAMAEQWSDAAAAFRQARALLPDDVAASHDVALALKKLGDYPGAVQEFEAALRLNSRAVGPRLGLAISLDRLGRVADAVKAYEECLLLMPAGADADRIRARVARLNQ